MEPRSEEDAPLNDETMMQLYKHLADRRARQQALRDLPREARNAYHAKANRRSREKARAAREAGAILPTTPVVRQVLADAGIMLLATDGPGAQQVRHALARAFPGRVGLPMTVTQQAKSGRLKPKLLA